MNVQSSYFSGDLLQGSMKKDPKAVGQMMESMFYRMLLKQVREEKLGEDLFESHQSDQINEWQDEEMAHQLGAMGALGVAAIVEESLKKQEMAPQGILKAARGGT